MNPNPQNPEVPNKSTKAVSANEEILALQRARDIAFINDRAAHDTALIDRATAKGKLSGAAGHIQNEAGHDTQLLQAKNRTAEAEARTAEAKTRIERAETRTERAEIRTEQAETRTEQAKTRIEQAETRTEEAEARSEQAILASELGYRRLFEAAREGILILESDTGTISDANPFLIAMLGFSRAEVVGTPIWELGSFRDIVANRAKFEHLQTTGYVSYENLPLETKDARKLVVEFVSTVYQVGDRNVIQCYVRDITERKRLEQKIRCELEQQISERTRQLEEANHELRAFSYSVSHDLQAPLHHIVGFANLLLTGAEHSLSVEQRHFLKNISDASSRMKELIDDLLLFARVGRAELRKTEVNLADLVREVLKDPQLAIRERNILWDVRALPAVQADHSLLRMVLINLISNAIKFTGGRAEAKIEIGCQPGGEDETVIYIRDNGAGFDPAYAHRLFGVFQRLHNHDEFEGTGIGLANVQRIIQRHSGRVWAEAAPDAGATFYFSLPKSKTTETII